MSLVLIEEPGVGGTLNAYLNSLQVKTAVASNSNVVGAGSAPLNPKQAIKLTETDLSGNTYTLESILYKVGNDTRGFGSNAFKDMYYVYPKDGNPYVSYTIVNDNSAGGTIGQVDFALPPTANGASLGTKVAISTLQWLNTPGQTYVNCVANAITPVAQIPVQGNVSNNYDVSIYLNALTIGTSNPNTLNFYIGTASNAPQNFSQTLDIQTVSLTQAGNLNVSAKWTFKGLASNVSTLYLLASNASASNNSVITPNSTNCFVRTQ
jgi:hypothetical protein